MEQPFSELVAKLHEDVSGDIPMVSHIVADANMNRSVRLAAENFQIPLVHLFPIAACALLVLKHYRVFIEKYLKPSNDESSDIGGDCSDGLIDWIPGMNNMRLCDLPFLSAVEDENKSLLSFTLDLLDRTGKAEATIIHTFEELEPVALHELSSIIPNVYAIGPLHLLL
ncbi:hypothetical protein MLD38_021197 [Melastoma candidum]|uniref:Uncharacterized protein n=1 Tax=Melastoma candidum TaxID=119954 RepID=A0ACB9QFC7_9MYRT|nr:hypothetical protein MLD38_021197 [Melastoma candidum]